MERILIIEDETPMRTALADAHMAPEAITHLGVYIGEGRVLHTIQKLNSSLFRIDDRFWSGKIRGYYRWAN